ncbi:MAG: tRNA 2-thiouridine(34) synthase MnmA [Clostridia bacterium]|nr:tRNA 2-thiouridine(34) synthase MnmA [Clostridia bacterium]
MKRVWVGMSGGIDSSAAAWVLKQQGYAPEGVTLQLLDGAESDANDARLMAQTLNIPHCVLDYRSWFFETVMQNFADTYLAGDTPNPCLVCNKMVKFGKLLDDALAAGAEAVATGHYVQREQASDGRWLLKKAVDTTKDQSYVLYSLTQHQLSHSLFPLGGMTKAEIRRLAEENGWVTAHKSDSQDICFVPDGDYVEFLERTFQIKRQTGDFLNANGECIGKHTGMIGYTIGQRKGLGVAFGEPRYVTAKDAANNTVTLGKHDELFSLGLVADDVNWILFDELKEPLRVTAKTRYSQKEAAATVEPFGDSRMRVVFDEPQRALTTGQAVVLYQGDYVVGGGTIRGAQ